MNESEKTPVYDSLVKQASKLRENFPVNFGIVFFILLILKGHPFPYKNEFVYLLDPIKRINVNFLLNDWTFSRPDGAHYVFNILVAPLTVLLPLEVLAWAGRIGCWTLIIVALFKIGKHFNISLWMISLAIILWILQSHKIVGKEWIFGGFEAKVVSYVFLFFSINGFINQRIYLASSFLGLSFSFHPGVGLWGGLGSILSLIVMKYSVKKLCKITGLVIVLALPGAVPLIPTLFENGMISMEDWKRFALIAFPNHLDPFSWNIREILILYLLLLFNWIHLRANRGDQSLKFIFLFQFFLCVFFSMGLVIRWVEKYELLKFMPFRLFPLLIPIFFFFHLMRAYSQRSSLKLRNATLCVGVFAIIMLNNNPLKGFATQLSSNYHRWKWTAKEDDFVKSLKWISENTENGSIIISPPWRYDGWYFSKRAQIANLHPPSGRLSEWRERIEALGGEMKAYSNPNEFWSVKKIRWIQQMEIHYDNLTKEDIRHIIVRYGGNYLVSKTEYDYSMLFDSGTYKVYSLNQNEK